MSISKSNKSNKSTSHMPKMARRARKAAERAAIGKAETERAIEEAAARGDRKLVEKLTAPKAPARSTLEALMNSYLEKCAKEHTEAYAASIRRPISAFVTWCDSHASHLDLKALERYRAHCEKQGWALSTLRMHLARVQTFLRAQKGIDATALKALRVQHTKKEKKHLAELAEARVEAEAPKARKSKKAA